VIHRVRNTCQVKGPVARTQGNRHVKIILILDRVLIILLSQGLLSMKKEYEKRFALVSKV
jgi:hypothetical protein